jgi:hypothetical protein
MTVYADYQYLVDWNGDGSYGHTRSDISQYVLDASFQRGSNDGIPSQAGAGSLSLKLDNASTIFSPDNESSPIFGLIVPFLRVRLIMSISRTPAYMFTGFMESVDPAVGLPATISTASLKAYGIITRIQDEEAWISLQENITTGWLAGALFNAAGISAGDYDVETGLSSIAKYWQQTGSNLLSAIRDLEAEELGHIVEDPEGKLVFWDRSHYFTNPRSSAIQAAYGTGALKIWNLQRINSIRGIYNSVTGAVRTFNVTEENILLATITDVPNGLGGIPLIVPGNGSLNIFIDFPSPDSPGQYIGVDSWGIVDYQANASPDGTGDDLTSFLSQTTRQEYGPRLMIAFANASASPAHLVVLRAHGVAVVEGTPVPIKSEDAASIAKYGRRPYPFLFNWITNQADGQAKLDYIISEYKDPRARISFDVMGNYDAAHLAEVRTRREGDRIRVVAGSEFGLFIDAEFIVDAVAHRIGADRLHTMTLYCTEAPKSQLEADGTPHNPNKIPDADSIKRPDQLWTAGLVLANSIMFICGANKWNADITKAQIRAKRISSGTTVKSVDLRTPGEGGTFAHNGQDQIIIEDLYADWQGVRHQFFYGDYSGIWYWAVRLKNASGWSNWTDGNDNPQYVIDNVNTEGGALLDIGPPARWTITLRSGVQEGTAVAMATRPKINGNRIMSVTFQIRDASAGAWRNIDADAGAADTLYDGSEINHTFNPTTGVLRKESGDYGDAVASGGLLLIDVRQSSFDHRCVVWRDISPDQINGVEISGIQSFPAAFALNADGELSKLRVKIVRPPSIWNATAPAANNDGFHAEAGYRKRDFVYGGMVGDLDTDVFLSPPFAIPEGLTISDLEARVWFENIYSVSDDENHKTAILDAANLTTVPLVFHATAHGDGSNPPAAGSWAMIRIPCDLYIAGVTVLADQVGSIEFDVRRCLYDDYPDGPGDSVVATSPPALSNSQSYQDYTLAGWARGLNRGDVLVLYVKSGAASIQKATITLECLATVAMGSGAAPGSDSLPSPWGYWPMDEVSTFQVPNAPSIWWHGNRGSGNGDYLWIKTTFQLEGDSESLANGPAYGPIYIPPGKGYQCYWKTGARSIGLGGWEGGGAGTMFFDDSWALQNVRLKGYKIYTNSIEGGPVGIKGWQAIYRAADGGTVYGPVRGTTSGETENQFVLGDDEYITQLKGYRDGSTAYQNKIYRLEFVTNKGSHVFGSAHGTAFTIDIPAQPVNGAYTFAGLYGSYAGDPKAIRRVGVLYCIDTFDNSIAIPDDVIGWNLYASADGINFDKKNRLGVIGLGSLFTFPEA